MGKETRDRAKMIWIEHEGRLGFSAIASMLKSERHGKISVDLMRAWKSRYSWPEFEIRSKEQVVKVANAEAAELMKELRELPGPVEQIDFAISSTLAAIVVIQHKSRAALNDIEARSAEQIADILKLGADMVQIAERLQKLRGGVVASRIGALDDVTGKFKGSINGEIIPPEKPEKVEEPRPAPLADRTEEFRRAR